tara:strand:- start:1231 stop:1794 length:564 start_codon:yes stop_codon:yes gene_type:complete
VNRKSIILSAPSGAGKTSIVKFLLNEISTLSFSISATSREKRGKEVDGLDYFFLSTDYFKERIEKNNFLEWEEVYPDQFYGTLNSELERIWSDNMQVIFDVDVKGGVNIKNKFKANCLSIFIAPPSLKELEARLINRGTDTTESISKRLKKAEYEMLLKGNFDVVVVNDDLNEACNQTLRLVKNFII